MVDIRVGAWGRIVAGAELCPAHHAPATVRSGGFAMPGATMLYALSKAIPVPMSSTYTVHDHDGPHRETATWIQWRNRIWRHRRHPA